MFYIEKANDKDTASMEDRAVHTEEVFQTPRHYYNAFYYVYVRSALAASSVSVARCITSTLLFSIFTLTITV